MNAKILLGKLLLGLVCTLLSAACYFWLRRVQLSWDRFRIIAWMGMIITRMGMFCLLFIALQLTPQSDASGYYYPQMKVALQGGLPYRDYFSAYAPLFAYIGGAALRIWSSPKAIVLLAIGFEAVGFAAWLGFAKQAFRSETAQLAAALYVVNVLPIFNTAIDGQNQAWVSCFLGLSAILLWQKRWASSGLAFSGGLVAVKILPLVFAPAFWLQTNKSVRWLVGCTALPALIYGACLLNHLDVLQPLRFEGQEITSGCLPFLLAPFCPQNTPVVAFDILLGLVLLGVIIVAIKSIPAKRLQRCVYLVVLILLVLLVFSKKAFTNYLVMAWFPFCLCAASAKQKMNVFTAAMLGAFGTLALIEPSLWFRWFNRRELKQILATCIQGGTVTQHIHLITFLVCEVALISMYIWYAWQAWTLYFGANNVDELPPPDSSSPSNHHLSRV